MAETPHAVPSPAVTHAARLLDTFPASEVSYTVPAPAVSYTSTAVCYTATVPAVSHTAVPPDHGDCDVLAATPANVVAWTDSLQPAITVQRVQRTVEMPQVQLIEKLVDVTVSMHRQVPAAQSYRGQLRFLDVSMQQHFPAVQVERRTIEVLEIQVQSIDRVVATPVLQQTTQTGHHVPESSVNTLQAQFINGAVSISVVQQSQVPTVRTLKKSWRHTGAVLGPGC